MAPPAPPVFGSTLVTAQVTRRSAPPIWPCASSPLEVLLPFEGLEGAGLEHPESIGVEQAGNEHVGHVLAHLAREGEVDLLISTLLRP